MLCVNIYRKPGAKVSPPLPHLLAFALQVKLKQHSAKNVQQLPVSQGKVAFDNYHPLASKLN